MTDPVLQAQDLKVEFPTRRGSLIAVDGISLEIEAGEILGLVGESGAGKSMTGMAVLGLIEPPGHITQGSITLAGARIDDLSEKQFERIRGREIGAIFQDPLTSLNPTIAAGWVAGLVQAWIKKPTVRDLEDLADSILTPRGWWGNAVTRVLLVMILANLGSTLGTFIAGGWIAARVF